MRRPELYRHPHARQQDKILPGSSSCPLRRRRERQRHEHKECHHSDARNGECLCSKSVNEIRKKRRRTQDNAATNSQPRGKHIAEASRSAS
jgi:hypothetical protein